MDLVLHLTLLSIILAAVFFDIKERRIPNWIVMSGLIAGVGLGGFRGSTQLLFSLGGFVFGLSLLIIPFAFGWMGAGDVKLFAMVGAIVGYKPLPRVFFYSCIVAGITALVAIAFGKAREVSFKNFWTDCKFMFLTVRTGPPQSLSLESGGYSVPWGVAIGAGTVIAYYVDPSGKWAGF